MASSLVLQQAARVKGFGDKGLWREGEDLEEWSGDGSGMGGV